MAKKKEELNIDFNNMDDVNTLINRIVKEMMAAGVSGQGVNDQNGSVVYGFNIKIDQNGISLMERSEKEMQPQQAPQSNQRNEPLVDLIYRPDEIIIIAELHGAKKEQIELTVDKLKLNIRAGPNATSYNRNVFLSEPFDPTKSQAKYNNGILEIVLKKGSYSGKTNQIRVT